MLGTENDHGNSLSHGAQYSDIKHRVEEEMSRSIKKNNRLFGLAGLGLSLVAVSSAAIIVNSIHMGAENPIISGLSAPFSRDDEVGKLAATIPQDISFKGRDYLLLKESFQYEKNEIIGYIVCDPSKIASLGGSTPEVDLEFIVDASFYDAYLDSVAPIYSLVNYDSLEYIGIETSVAFEIFHMKSC